MTTYSPIYQSVRREVLNNGLTTLIASPDKKTRTVAAYLAVKTGAADEGKWLGAGLSHFVEHMFFKGTSERNKGMIEKEVRRIGGDINAYTSHDLTVFHVTGLASEVDTAINLLYDAAFHSVLDPEEMNREREVIVSEMRMNEDRLDRKTLLTLWNRMYTGHPYENPVIGYESVFRASTREDLKAFMDEYYVPNNMVLSVVGDVDPDHVSDYVKQTFGSAARKSIEPVYRTQPIAQQSRRFTSVQKPAQHIRFMIGYPTPPAGHADAPALDVLAEI
ncbi:MAG: insulinase family protein, partial [Candidatus Omnitrophica bacterium]|nr:insulinase family protein [Candidatus Omnitrophota bacterium]